MRHEYVEYQRRLRDPQMFEAMHGWREVASRSANPFLLAVALVAGAWVTAEVISVLFL